MLSPELRKEQKLLMLLDGSRPELITYNSDTVSAKLKGTLFHIPWLLQDFIAYFSSRGKICIINEIMRLQK